MDNLIYWTGPDPGYLKLGKLSSVATFILVRWNIWGVRARITKRYMSSDRVTLHQRDAHHSMQNSQLAHRNYLHSGLSLEAQVPQSRQDNGVGLVHVSGDSPPTAHRPQHPSSSGSSSRREIRGTSTSCWRAWEQYFYFYPNIIQAIQPCR